MRYQLIEDVVQGVWQDFQPGWLYQMQRLPKWQEYRKNLQPGTMVLMFNDDKLKSTRNQWDVGRILSVVTGKDGQARKAHVIVQRPQNTEHQYQTVAHLRPVNKLVPIDIVADQVAKILPLDLSKYPLPEVESDNDENPIVLEEPDDNPVLTTQDNSMLINDLRKCEMNTNTLEC
jgi:hypothetical protein